MTDNFFSNLIETGEIRVDEDGHLEVMNEFCLLVPSPVAGKLYYELEKELGEDRCAKVWRDLGRYQVEQAAERYSDQYNFDTMSKDKIVNFTSQLLKILGFGDIKFSEFNRNEGAKVVLAGSVLASRYRNIAGEKDRPVDHWVAGILDRHFEVIFGVEVEVEELKCLAMGDEKCVFDIKAIN